MGRFRVALVLGAVLTLTEAAVLAVSLWLPADRGPFRVGYGYEPPSAALLSYLQARDFRLIEVDRRHDQTAIPGGSVDVAVSSQPGLAADGSPIEWVTVSYDPQLSRSVDAAHRLEALVNGYPGAPKAHALVSSIADVPSAFHLFFAVVLPLLIVVAAAAGALAGAARRPYRYALAFVAAMFTVLFFVLPGTDFPGPEGTSSRIGWLSPVGMLLEVPVALAFVAALVPSLRGDTDRRLTITVAALAAVLAFLLSASLWDTTPSAWPVSNTPQLITAGGLLACAAVGVVLARRSVRRPA